MDAVQASARIRYLCLKYVEGPGSVRNSVIMALLTGIPAKADLICARRDSCAAPSQQVRHVFPIALVGPLDQRCLCTLARRCPIRLRTNTTTITSAIVIGTSRRKGRPKSVPIRIEWTVPSTNAT